MLEYFKGLFEYEFWAMEKVLESLATAEMKPGEKILKTASHLVLTHQTWLCRLQGKPNIDISRELDLPQMKVLTSELKEAWKIYFATLSEEKLAQKISYVNFQNVACAPLLSDALAHIVNHASYHRGQIASLVKQAGGIPCNSDYITFVKK